MLCCLFFLWSFRVNTMFSVGICWNWLSVCHFCIQQCRYVWAFVMHLYQNIQNSNVIKKLLFCMGSMFRRRWPGTAIYSWGLWQARQACLLLRHLNFCPCSYGSVTLTTRSSCQLRSKSHLSVHLQLHASFIQTQHHKKCLNIQNICFTGIKIICCSIYI